MFDYLAIAFGLVYSVTALRLIGGLPSATAPERRYWVHVGTLVVLLLGVIASFWTFWSLAEVDWTFPRFMLALAIPGLLYYCAVVMVPENPEAVPSWREHYYAARRRYFVAFGLWGLVTAIGATVNLGMPLAHPARGLQGLVMVLGVLGTVSARPRVHAAIVLVLFAIWAAWGVTAGLHAAPLAD